MGKNIVIATIDNIEEIVNMALKLWTDNTYESLKEEFIEILHSNKQDILLYSIDDEYIGFNHVAIRHDYVEGSSTSPVGYMEGIFVKKEYRNRGIARELVEAGEGWTKARGCTQMGSDVEFHNVDSYNFHKSIGYDEVNRIISFLKNI